jgi:hypothetical protein
MRIGFATSFAFSLATMLDDTPILKRKSRRERKNELGIMH